MKKKGEKEEKQTEPMRESGGCNLADTKECFTDFFLASWLTDNDDDE